MQIGCDIESVEVFRDHWQKGNIAFFSRIFSEHEIEYCKKFKDPSPHFAARFCAKEAIVKASSLFCNLLITDLQILGAPKTAPQAARWKEREQTQDFFDRFDISVSLSHTHEIAMANAIVDRKKT